MSDTTIVCITIGFLVSMAIFTAAICFGAYLDYKERNKK